MPPLFDKMPPRADLRPTHAHVLSELTKERSDILYQEIWLLCSRKMPATRHFRPLTDVIDSIGPLARRNAELLRKDGDACRCLYALSRGQAPRIVLSLVVHADRRIDSSCKPIYGYICEDLIL